jgi:hypothetical protein
VLLGGHLADVVDDILGRRATLDLGEVAGDELGGEAVLSSPTVWGEPVAVESAYVLTPLLDHLD